jgi:hypothetical protein
LFPHFRSLFPHFRSLFPLSTSFPFFPAKSPFECFASNNVSIKAEWAYAPTRSLSAKGEHVVTGQRSNRVSTATLTTWGGLFSNWVGM